MSVAALESNNKTIFHDVVHCEQRFGWDCGVACVRMLLPAAERRHLEDNLRQVCEEEGFGCNTWTIDLCYLMKRYGLASQLYTTTAGANETHRKKKFYERYFHKDRERVNERFIRARSADIECFERNVGGAEMERWLSVGPLIVLVDADALSCQLCKRNKFSSQFRWLRGGYCGHYVVCAGMSRGRVYYADPARQHVCVTSSAEMTRARTARGTDQDVIRVLKARSFIQQSTNS